MDSPANQPCTQTTLTAPTDLILAALRIKEQPFTIADHRDALPDIEGPALIFRDTVVIGEAAVLGWIDRRYPWPDLFPAEPELYAKASTLAHALEQTPDLAHSLWGALSHPKHLYLYLLGPTPTIADLALWAALTKVDTEAADQFKCFLFPQIHEADLPFD